MKRFAIGAAVLVMAGGARAAAVCDVSAVQGRAELVGQAAPLKKGQGLAVGAELRTGAGGRVRLRCVDGSTLVLGDNSRLQLEFFQPGPERRASFLLNMGLLGQTVKPAEKPEESRWQVRTPSAVTAVRGTEFLVEVAKDQSTAVHVLSGAVAVEPQDVDAAAAAPSEPFSSKDINTRGFRPKGAPVAVLLDAAGASTRCAAQSGCKAAAGASAADLRKLRARLGL